MGNFLDIVLIIALIGSVALCYKLGFFKLLLPFRKLAAFLLAWSLKDSAIVNQTVGKLIRADVVQRFINGRVNALWGERLANAASAEGVSITERFDGIFGFAGEIFSNLKSFCVSLYDRTLASGVANGAASFSEAVEGFVADVTDYVTGAVVGFFTTFLGFILLYIIFSVGFWLVTRLLDGIFEDGLIGSINSCIGGVIGIVYGFLFAWVLSIVFVLVLPLVTSVSVEAVLSGGMGVTEWFYTKFFISQLLGISL